MCASGLYTLYDVLQKNDWNEHEIENRAEWLLANAQNIWKIYYQFLVLEEIDRIGGMLSNKVALRFLF